MENKNKKIILILSSILFFLILILIGLILKNKNLIFSQNKETAVNQELEASLPKETTIYFVGDLMLTRGVESSVNKNFDGDFFKLFKNIKKINEADILFGNLEGPVSSLGNNVGSKYSFRMKPSVLPALKETGFDIFSFANNHVGDWNISAFNDTLSLLEENNILKTGAGKNLSEVTNPTIIEKNGIRFGFLGFSDVGPKWMEAEENKSGILLANNPNYESIIKKAKEASDVLVVSIHFGEEYKEIHNKRQESLAHKAIDSGADIIIGHHPHVIQDIEFYQGKPIVYSLGNFMFDQSFSKETMRSMVFMTTFKGKDLIKADYLISIQNKKFQIEGLFKKEEVEDIEELIHSNCPKPSKEFEDMSLFPLGQKIGLIDNNYIPKNMVHLGNLAIDENICLTREVKKAFKNMLDDAKKDGIKIKATSAYRNYNYQKMLYENALISNPQAKIAVSKPGHSEHHLGTTIDLSGESIGYSSANSKFNNTKEELWLRDNAYKYGFVMSYPYGKEDITGYMYEPWHYRYLGINIAQEIKNLELTISEYLK